VKLASDKTAGAAHAVTLKPLWPHLTGAVCKNELLNVTVPSKAPDGYDDPMSRLFDSYHINDLGMFDGAVRQNAIDRVAAFASHPTEVEVRRKGE
jgi:hypothetical protein